MHVLAIFFLVALFAGKLSKAFKDLAEQMPDDDDILDSDID